MTRAAAVALSTALVAVLAVHAQNPPAAPSAAPTTGTALITGRVVDAENGAPIASTLVSLGPGGGPGTAVTAGSPLRLLTDTAGRFFFSGLSAGKFSVSTSKAGWIPGAFGRRRPGGSTLTIDLGDAERQADVSIPMWRFAVISGRVVDEAGDPIVNADIRAAQQTYVGGRKQLAFAGRTHTDDRGAYRFSSLMPGDYLVVVPATVMTEPSNFTGVVRAEGETPKPYFQTMTALGTAPMLFNRSTVPAESGFLVSSLLGIARAPIEDTAWVTYPTTFYPSAIGTGFATVVRAVSGRDRSGTDLIVRLMPTYQVSGVLSGPDGPAASHVVHLIPRDAGDVPLLDVASAVTDAAGNFSMFGVPAGQYLARVVRTPWPTGGQLGLAGGTGAVPYVSSFTRGPSGGAAPIPTEPLLYVDQAVTVSDRHVPNVQLVLRAGPRITGQALFDGLAPKPAPADWQNIAVNLERASGLSNSAVAPGQFTDDERFSTPSLWPGRYLIRVNRPPAGWAFKDAKYQGRDVSDTPLDIAADISDVTITFTDHPTKIDGTVQDAAGQPAVGATVLLFPQDSAAWVDYGRTSRRLSSALVSASGKFTLAAPPAGDYCLVALPDEQAADWQNPAVLGRLIVTADRIQIRDGESLTRQLRIR